MKLFISFLMLGAVCGVWGQGSIVFRNDATSLVYTNALSTGGTRGLTEPIPGAFYYALFTAPQGTTDPLLFAFAGAYATNSASFGRYEGGTLAVPPSPVAAVLVRGWSSNLGSTWNPNWQIGHFDQTYGFYGQSGIAIVDFNPFPPPQFPIPIGQYVGSFDLLAIPEPSTIAIILTAFGIGTLRRRRSW